jgi:mannose-6-phosphate isomerase-like protein (cupin superfamily)
MITLDLEKQGERLTFFGEADSGAECLELEVRMAPGADGPPPHIHTRSRETFRVKSGRMVATVDGEAHEVEVGQRLELAPGQVHTFSNGSEREALVAHVTMAPALHFQWALSELARAAIRAGGSWDDLPFLEMAYIMYAVRDEYRVAGMPVVVQDVLFGVAARLASVLGRTKEIAPRDGVASRAGEALEATV